MIKIEKVHKYFNKRKKSEIHVINDTTLSLENIGLVALLGPSGSGKTTLLNVIGGLDKVNKGKIYIDGERITRRNVNKIDKIRNLNIGYIFQDYKLVDNMTVYDNIALVLKMIGIKDKKEIKKRVNYVLEVLNIYRYRNRYASMLSGGERQRVGIARAIVKDPNIIIADEPTGNLDSKNTLEIMNIIKSISKNRLVILVTHERELAKFYASRVIELEDGQIINDYKNKDIDQLDYRLENNIYLKDFKNYTKFDKENINIDFYSDEKEKIDLNIIIKNGNFYIKNNSFEKIEIIDDNSGIELIDDHYKKIDKTVYQKYEFNFNEVINKNIKKSYSSIYNLFSLIAVGFKKLLDYSFIKKILLLGFFASSMFILLSLSRMFAVLNVEDKDFITSNKNYLQINMEKLNVANYLTYEQSDIINYMIPGDSSISFVIYYNDYYQTTHLQDSLKGSLSSLNMITENDIIYGRYPSNEYEIVIDELTAYNMFSSQSAQSVGITKPEQLLNRTANIENMDKFIIVGITNLKSPSIYVNESLFINILSNKTNQNGRDDGFYIEVSKPSDGFELPTNILDINLYKEDIKLKKGRFPEKDYEIIVNYENRYSMPLNKTIDNKINNQKLKVVGYYTSDEENNNYYSSLNTVKIQLIEKSNNITVYSENKELALNYFREQNLNINDSYDVAKKEYKENMRESVLSTLIVSGVIIVISLIEIFLMIRASFLSRIKEIGIFRAIGVKKSDIYKMFVSEIIAITVIACLSGIALMTYCLKVLSEISILSKMIMINTYIVLFAIMICLVFNLLIGLIPVYNTLRKTPAQILARHDLE